jgi:predicted DsbA family dithiol-disulfide isomerase
VALRSRIAQPVSLVLYEDPICPWCLVAERRITTALEDVGPAPFGPLRLEPFPIRPEPRALTRTDRRALAAAARRAAKEPEAKGTGPDLWLSPDPPLTSLPALRALAAARLQGATREAALRGAIREAALVRGLNVSRTDVLLELAEWTKLDLGRFGTALAAPATEQRVLDSLAEADDKGIKSAPALVIGDEWLVSGPRAIEDYRAVLRRYASARLGVAPERTLH